jgi:hypothetical protein
MTISGASPALESMTLFCYPAPQGTRFVDLSLLVAEQVQTLEGIEEHMNINEMLDFINDRWLTKVLVTLQVGSTTIQGTIEQYRFEAMNEGEEQKGSWNGIAPISFKEVR